jgi:hypothetical protein
VSTKDDAIGSLAIMNKQPEDRDIAGFIVDSGGMWRAVRRLLSRDGLGVFANPAFWGLLIHAAFASAYWAVIIIGVPLALCYFVYLAFASGVSTQAHNGAMISLAVVVLLCLGLWWLDR